MEKEAYVSFHLNNYKIDFASALKFLEQKNSKYTAIAGYYSVLNITLWYFAKYYNLKISEEDTGVHTNCLIVLEHFIKEELLKKKIIQLLEKAKTEFLYFTILKKNKEETLPLMLKQSADKRKKYTYYSIERELPKETDQLNEVKMFVKSVVEPYISILERLKP